MTATQWIGSAAAVLTFLTFVSSDMRRLRVLAPVLALHLALAAAI